MPSNQVTATALLASFKRRAYIPGNGGPSNVDICARLTEELLVFVAPLLMEIGEEFFVASSAFSTVANTGAYDIPEKSIGSKIRDVQILLDDGVTWESLEHEEPERASNYAHTATRPVAYYIQNNEIVLLPTPTGVQSMRIRYYKRPRDIVSTGYSNASLIALLGGVYTVTVPSTAGMVDGDFDILDPATFQPVTDGEGLPGEVDSDTTLTFNAADLTADQITALAAATGDTFIGSGNAPIADVPPEAAILVTQRAAAVWLQSASDPRSAQAFAEVERVKVTLRNLFAPRASGRPRRVVNLTGPGWGALGRAGGRRRWV
jgi:hypothetical protein